jgi:SAM-dependent methyltransferase
MGSAAIQGRLWGARAEAWAEGAERVCLPLHAAVLDAARVSRGTRLLDAGCGAGLLALSSRASAAQAMGELARVVRPGGRVVVTAWGPRDRCEFLTAVMPGLATLMPPPPPGAAPPRPGALSEPGALAAVSSRARLGVVEEGEVACPFVFPSAEAAWRANAGAGIAQAAVAHSGEAAVRAVFADADRAHSRPDGSARYENVFLWAAGQRP